MMTKLVATWIGDNEARILRVHPHRIDEVGATPRVHHVHHPKGPDGVAKDPEATRRFFHDVARSLDGAREILLLGPWTAKLEFLRYVHKHYYALEPRIVGIDTEDHPTDVQLIDYARKYFRPK